MTLFAGNLFITFLLVLIIFPTHISSFEDYQSRIVGGIKSYENKWPFTAALLYRGEQMCGGVVWDQWHVLTAAHCLCHNKSTRVHRPLPYSVFLGHHNLEARFWFWDWLLRDDYEIGVKEIISHPMYDPKIHYRFDIAILRLSTPIDFGHQHIGVRCVCQPEPLENLDLTNCYTMGWGSTVPVHGNRTAVKSTQLLEIAIPILSDQKCSRHSVHYNPHWHVCAMAPEGGRDACKGDSGGSLVCLLKGSSPAAPVWSLVGLTSFGSDHCGNRGSAGFYTRVHRMLYWIETHTQDYEG